MSQACPGWKLCLLSDQPALLGVQQQVTMVTGQYANFCPVGPGFRLGGVTLCWLSGNQNMMSRRLFGFLFGFCFAGADIAAGPSESTRGAREAGLLSASQPSTAGIQDSTGLWLKGKASQGAPKAALVLLVPRGVMQEKTLGMTLEPCSLLQVVGLVLSTKPVRPAQGLNGQE